MDGACLPGCLSDRDCPRDLHCLTSLPPRGQCVQCLEESHCPDRQTCIAGTCVATCHTRDDCASTPETPFCDTATGLCVACLSEADCPLGSLCVDRSCRPGCRSDRDCPEGQKCDRAFGDLGGCFECLADGDCGERVCRDHQCVVDCSLVRCPAERPVCDPGSGKCLECLEKADCRRGHLCIQGVCQPGCEEDRDCPSELHCLAGSCVECTSDDHCPSPQKCRANRCSTAECSRDTDCPAEKYCHPLLQSCMKLPSNYCRSDADCLSLIPGLFDQVCDPLTRSCIPPCFQGLLCLDLLGTSRTVCVDNRCYQCGSDSDCQGVRCDPFDRTCRSCRTDQDCALPGWHCATDGACYACLNDSHCSWPQVCDATGSHRCVDCLSDRDCKDPFRPVCGKSRTCIPPCGSECVQGARICNPDDTTEPISYLTCGDFDDDPCLEYGSPANCGNGATCRVQGDGSGRCVCDNACTSGQKRCTAGTTDTLETCTQSSVTGCWYWYASYCGTGEVCSGGDCVCTNECEPGQAICNGSTQVRKCEKDYYTQCPVWRSYNCPMGASCRNGVCQ